MILLFLCIIGCIEANGEVSNNSTIEQNNTIIEEQDCSEILELWQSIEKYEYVWGGESKDEGGFDCSGAIYYIQKRIGKPVPRTTSKKYNLLADGQSKHWKNGTCNDWIWWTFTPDRPYGHIGMHIKSDNIWQSGSSTGPTQINIWNGSYWDRIFEETKSPY